MYHNTEESMKDNSPIKHLIIGESSNNKIIIDFLVDNEQPKEKKELILKIFDKICTFSNKKTNERYKIYSKNKNENYYFGFRHPDYIYLILISIRNEYPERYIFELFDKINDEIVNKMVNNESRELNPNGIQALKQLIDVYQNPMKMNNEPFIKDCWYYCYMHVNKKVESDEEVKEI